MQQKNSAVQFLSGLIEGILVQVTTPHPQIVTAWALVAERQDPNQLRLIEVPSGKQLCTHLEGAFDWEFGHNLAIQCGMTPDKDAIVLRYVRLPPPAEASQAARILLQSHSELRNVQYADHAWMVKHLLALAKQAPITITRAQLEVLIAEAKRIEATDLHSRLLDLRQQFGHLAEASEATYNGKQGDQQPQVACYDPIRPVR